MDNPFGKIFEDLIAGQSKRDLTTTEIIAQMESHIKKQEKKEQE